MHLLSLLHFTVRSLGLTGSMAAFGDATPSTVGRTGGRWWEDGGRPGGREDERTGAADDDDYDGCFRCFCQVRILDAAGWVGPGSDLGCRGLGRTRRDLGTICPCTRMGPMGQLAAKGGLTRVRPGYAEGWTALRIS